MNAFLVSHHLREKHLKAFRKLMGKPKATKALFVTTAAVPYGLSPKPAWLEESLQDMRSLTETFDETSLEEESFVPQDLKQYDFIFVSGGNTFYLAYRFSETGFSKKIREYIHSGGVYSGSSAGAIVLMDNIDFFAPADDPSKTPRVSSGLGLIDFAVVPHADSQKYAERMKGIAENYRNAGKDVVTLNDDQVLVINDDLQEVL